MAAQQGAEPARAGKEDPALVTAVESETRFVRKSLFHREKWTNANGGGAGSRILPASVGDDRSGSVSIDDTVAPGQIPRQADPVSIGIDPSGGRMVEPESAQSRPTASPAARTDSISRHLTAALLDWHDHTDRKRLRASILQLLLRLEE